MTTFDWILVILTIFFVGATIRVIIALSRISMMIEESLIVYDETGTIIRREFILKDGFRYIHVGGLNTFPVKLIREHGRIIGKPKRIIDVDIL